MAEPRGEVDVAAFEARLREQGFDPTDVYEKACNIAVGYLDDVMVLLADVATKRSRKATPDTQDLGARTLGAVLAGVAIALGMDAEPEPPSPRSAAGQETGK
jgi:hypothetical protein